MIDDDDTDLNDTEFATVGDLDARDADVSDFSAQFDMPEDQDEEASDHFVQAEGKPDLNLIMDIPVTMQVVLGTAVMPVASLVKLGRGAVVKLDTTIGEPVDVIVNGRIVARGEVVVLENEESRFGITLTEIVSPGAHAPRPKSSGV